MLSAGRSLLMALLLSGGIATHAEAIVLDQSNIFVIDPNGEIGGPTEDFFQSAGQTFTVGIAGRLAQIGLQIQQGADGATDDALLSIFTFDGAALGAAPLGSVPIPASSVPAFSNFTSAPFAFFDVSTLAIDVAVGQMLAILVSFTGNETGGSYFIFDDEMPPVPYERGISFTIGTVDGFFIPIETRDLGFQTFVQVPAVVPLPASGVLLLAAVAATAAMRRRPSRCGTAVS